MQGKLSISSIKYKEFVEKHRHAIEIMNKYYCLSEFTIFSYNEKGKRKENLAEDYFYQYIQNHYEDIEKIKAVALKIKNLGFNKIKFSEKIDFTKFKYELDTLYGGDFSYLENIEIKPTYFNDLIEYKTNGSCYRLILTTNISRNIKEVEKYNMIIELNSLIFDPDRLPNEITTETTIGAIKNLAQNKKEDYENVRYSVDLNISISDLKDYFERLKAVTERIDKIKDNKDLKNLLSQMQNILTQLQLFGTNFENQLIDSYTDITDKTMKREKELYLNRRYLSNIDY